MDNDFTLKAQRCKYCGNAVHGRLDKQFCDDQCRNTYNNKSKRKDEQYILQINSQLRKNRRILKTLSPVGKSTVRKEVMVAMGYDGLAKLRGRFRRISLSNRQVSKPIKFTYLNFEQDKLNWLAGVS